MNFPLRSVEVILERVITPTMQVLWNGENTEAFSPSRGIRKGYSLSPYLFLLCMEQLNQIIEESIIGGAWKPIYESRGISPKLSNLLFANDIILFVEASSNQASVINDFLHRFCPEFISPKIFLLMHTLIFCDGLGMETTNDLGLYLEMPTLTSRLTWDSYTHICENVDRRLSGWKSKYLSLVGRILISLL